MKQKTHIYILAGQSNMAGRGIVQDQQTTNPRILSYNKQCKWEEAKDPVHWDKPAMVGVGPAISFAEQMLLDVPEDTSIGLVPCACGGSNIGVWEEGCYFDQTDSYPWDDAERRIKEAMKYGEIKGILWHQGEADARKDRLPVYKEKLENLITRFRILTENPNLPFVIGEIGQFPRENKEELLYRQAITEIHKTTADLTPYCAFVSSDGLTSIGDNLHFNTKSQILLGKRYATAMKSIQKRT